VAPLVTLRAGARRITAPGPLRLSGGAGPVKKRLSLVIARRGSGGYRTVATRSIRLTGGRFRLLQALGKGALYRLQAFTARDADNAAGASTPVFVRVAPKPKPSKPKRRGR
jgi:hypothetical protein